MPKQSRRQRRKQRTTRKRKIFRGGSYFQVTSPGKKTYSYKIPEKNESQLTVRTILKFFLDKEALTLGGLEEGDKTNPSYLVKIGSKINAFHDKWNDEITIPQNATVSFIPRNVKMAHIQAAKESETKIPLLGKVFQFAKGGKLIWEGSAIEKNDTAAHIQKNVKQQFHFHTQPFMPIVHIDSSFFNIANEENEFYSVLNFDEVPMEKTFKIPRTFARWYRKARGAPLELRSSEPTENEIAYLNEVRKEAKANSFNLDDEISILCVRFHFNSETQEIVNSIAKKYNLSIYSWSD
jgi:hypothetical protein